MLEKTLKVDMEIALERVDMALYHQLQKLEPFGVGNPEPVFASGAVVQSVRTVGQEGKHLKLQVAPLPTTNCQLPTTLDAIGFGMGEQAKKLKPGNQIKIAYAVALDAFNGNQRLQLKMKDIQS
jgi:single-stranded-DNA-specific exonuclease